MHHKQQLGLLSAALGWPSGRRPSPASVPGLVAGQARSYCMEAGLHHRSCALACPRAAAPQVEGLTGWLMGKETQQQALPGHEDALLHSSEVNSRVGEVCWRVALACFHWLRCTALSSTQVRCLLAAAP